MMVSNSKKSKSTEASQSSHSNMIYRAAVLSLGVSLLLFGVKFYAHKLTGSQSILSDALESIVNIATACVAIMVLAVASRPADQNHPYGHGKIEYFSSAFEGGLIFLAAIWISIEAAQSLFEGAQLRQLDLGMVIVALAGFVNLGVGTYLKRVGVREDSLALVASAQHLLSDFVTSVGIIVGLVIVRLTGLAWLDPIVALVVAVQLGYSGLLVVRKSTAELLDAEDRRVLDRLRELFMKYSFPGIIRIHYTRVMRAGRYHHVDAHVILPEFWTVDEAHEQTNRFERLVFKDYGIQGEFHFHLDPCRKAYCRVCDLSPCPIRVMPFESRTPYNIEELVSPTEPTEFQKSSV